MEDQAQKERKKKVPIIAQPIRERLYKRVALSVSLSLMYISLRYDDDDYLMNDAVWLHGCPSNSSRDDDDDARVGIQFDLSLRRMKNVRQAQQQCHWDL